MTLKCLPENEFEEVEWPNCKADILCPNPTLLENEAFAVYEAVTTDLIFNQTAKYDTRKYIFRHITIF